MTPGRLRGKGEAEGVGGQVRPSRLLCSSLECSPLLQEAGQSPLREPPSWEARATHADLWGPPQ